MKREEILALKPGIELDCLLAEHIMGCTRVCGEDGHIKYRLPGGAYLGIPDKDGFYVGSGEWFEPSRSIEDAMLVLCEARKKVLGGHYFLIGNDYDSDRYFCQLPAEVLEDKHAVTGNTISEAIAKAALLAVLQPSE